MIFSEIHKWVSDLNAKKKQKYYLFVFLGCIGVIFSDGWKAAFLSVFAVCFLDSITASYVSFSIPGIWAMSRYAGEHNKYFVDFVLGTGAYFIYVAMAVSLYVSCFIGRW